MYENYKKYIEEGKCVSCGRRLTEGYAYRRCEECRKAMKLREKDRKEKEKAKTELTKKRGYTLEEVSRMAVERGISYGQMVILLEQGKV